MPLINLATTFLLKLSVYSGALCLNGSKLNWSTELTNGRNSNENDKRKKKRKDD